MVSMESASDAATRAEPGNQEPREPWRYGLLAALAYVLAAVAMTWPFAARLGSATPGGGDPLLQIWVARWVQHALVTNPLKLYDANIFYPYANTLAYSDANVPAALLAAPTYLLTGNPILAVNLLVLGTFVLAAGGVYALATALVGNRAVAFLAGLAYAFLPYRYAHLWHLNQLGHAWTPWVLLALLTLIRRQTWPAALRFGFLFGVQCVTSFYVAFQIALVVSFVLLVAVVAMPRVRSRRSLGLLALSGLLAGAIILPLALPYLQVRDEQGFERTVREAESFQAPPTSYLKVMPENRPWRWLSSPTANYEDVLFPGGVASLGAALGLLGWRRRPALTILALLVGTAAFVIALGPTWRPDRGGTTPLPYRFLFDHFPFFKAMRVPARFGALVDFAVVLLAGFGAAWAWERLRARLPPGRTRAVGAALTAALALLILAELRSAPPTLVTVDRRPETAAPYRWLAEQPDNGAVLEFPIGISRTTGDPDTSIARAMYWSTLSWKPLVQGYSGFAPRTYADSLLLFTGDLTHPDGSATSEVSYVSARNVAVLQALGVRYLVLHKEGYKRRDWPVVIGQLAGTGQAELAGDFGNAVIYLLHEPDPATPPPAVNLALFAPSLVTPGQFWEPTVVVRNPQPRLGLLTVKRPLRLTTTWRDERGREVRRNELTLDLPAIVPPGDLYCSVRICPAASGVNAPDTLPGQRALRLAPDTPGRYAVELALTGDRTLSRTMTVEVVSAPHAAAGEGPPLAFVGATGGVDEYAPGDVVMVTLDWEVRARPAEDYTLFAQLIGPDGQVWGQYDAPAGWTSHYSATWTPGERVSLPWSVPLRPDAPAGAYRLLVGMYRRAPAGVARLPLRYPDGDAPEFWAGDLTVR